MPLCKALCIESLLYTDTALPAERAALATPQAHLEFLVFHMPEEETNKSLQSVTWYLFLVVKPGHLTKFSIEQVYFYSIRA